MYVTKRSIAILSLPLILGLSACDKDKPKDADSNTEPAKVEAKDLATLFTGDKVTVPGPYGALKLGMTLDEGKAAVPSLPDDGTIKPAEYPDQWFTADFDDETKQLRRLYFSMPKAKAVEAMTKQWGAPLEATEYDKKVLWWFNPEADLRASLADSFTDGEATIEFTHYMPIAKFLGEGPELAFQKDAPLLGLTAAEVEAKYGAWVKKETAEEAAKNQADIKKLAGEEAGAMMGKPTASLDLEYPPLEWGKYWTPVHFSWSDEGKIDRVWFALEYEPHPAAKDEIMAMLKNKWGEPKEEDEYGDKVYVFSETPFIKVEEDTISNAWDVFIEPAR